MIDNISFRSQPPGLRQPPVMALVWLTPSVNGNAKASAMPEGTDRTELLKQLQESEAAVRMQTPPNCGRRSKRNEKLPARCRPQ